MIESLPRLPVVEASALEEHELAHGAFAHAFGDASEGVARAFRYHQRRVQLEALAHVQTVDDGSLFAPHRRFLSRKDAQRVAGVSAAFRHVDSRVTMLNAGMITEVIGDDTPTVVHALLESHDPERRETNPGLVRATPTWFRDADVEYLPPDGESCGGLLASAVEVVRSAPVPAVVGAGWFASTLMAIHPFVDGNGRSARLLFHLLNSAGLSTGVDWGSPEMWTVMRRRYVSSLKNGQRGVAPGRLADVDTAEFVAFAVEASTAGARVCTDRLAAISVSWDAPWNSISDDSRLVELAVALSCTATLAELAELVGDIRSTELVNELVDAGRARWDGRNLLRLASDHPLLAP